MRFQSNTQWILDAIKGALQCLSHITLIYKSIKRTFRIVHSQ